MDREIRQVRRHVPAPQQRGSGKSSFSRASTNNRSNNNSTFF